MATRRTTTTATPAPAPAPAPLSPDQMHAAIAAVTIESAASLEAVDKALASDQRRKFDITIGGLLKQGELICNGYAPLLGFDPATCSGSTIHNQVKSMPDSPVYDHDDTRRKSMPSEGHFTRAAQIAQMHTPDLLDKYCAGKLMPFDKDRYILWLQVMTGSKVESDLLTGSTITRDDNGVVTAAVVKGSAKQGQRIADKQAKVKQEQDDMIRAAVAAAVGTATAPVTVAAPLHPLLAQLSDAATVDRIVSDGAARLAQINPANLDSLALLFVAAIVQRDRAAAAAAPAVESLAGLN